MPDNIDSQFYNRADAHINLSNQQAPLFGNNATNASMMYAAARFNVWLTSTSCKTPDELQAKGAEAIATYVKQYHDLLEENLADYVARAREDVKAG